MSRSKRLLEMFCVSVVIGLMILGVFAIVNRVCCEENIAPQPASGSGVAPQ